MIVTLCPGAGPVCGGKFGQTHDQGEWAVAVFGYDFARWWRLAPWSTNPLMRGRDRTAALAFACAMAVILGLVPFAALVGSLTYADLDAESVRTSATTQQIDAVVTTEPTLRSQPSGTVDVIDHYATVAWEWPPGQLHSDEIRVPDGTERGGTVPTRVDAEGRRVAEPSSATSNVLLGIAAAVGFWVVGTVVVATSLEATRYFDRRARMRQWDRDWLKFETERGRTKGDSA
ncbi:Rv1733c family protein [Rhodococcoides fascians]|uniref:Rv1733c family protein n=1 Tax=Rhodococcoides fascians TaxID=1828 RepID=UPI003FA769DD